MSKGKYYNTDNESGQELRDSIKVVERQEDAILNFFKSHPHNAYTPFQVWERVLPNSPISSVRRALANLTDARDLEKTHFQRLERWGKRNYLWRLNKDNNNYSTGLFSKSQKNSPNKYRYRIENE